MEFFFSLFLFLQICRIHDSAVNIMFDAQSVYKYVNIVLVKGSNLRKKITIISEPFTALYANIVSWV